MVSSLRVTLGNLQGHRFHSWENPRLLPYMPNAKPSRTSPVLYHYFPNKLLLMVPFQECAIQDKAHEIMGRRSNPELAEGAEIQERGRVKGERWNRRTIIVHHVPLTCGCSG